MKVSHNGGSSKGLGKTSQIWRHELTSPKFWGKSPQATDKVILTSHQLEENVTVHLRRFLMVEKLKSNRKNKRKYKIFLEIIVDASSLIV